MKNAFRGITVGLVAVSFLVIGLIVASNFSLTPDTQARTEALWTDGTGKKPAGQPGSFADLTEELSPAVVNISTATVIKEGEAQHPFGGEDSPFRDFSVTNFSSVFSGTGRSGPLKREASDRALSSTVKVSSSPITTLWPRPTRWL